MEKDFCSKCDCGEKNYIVNKTYKLCDKKNKERLESRKQPDYKKNKIKKVFKDVTKQKNRLIAIQDVYLEISEERERICEGCGTDKMLSHSHIIPRSRRKDLEAEKQNIVYHCLPCHSIWEHGAVKDKSKLHNFEKMMEYIKATDKVYYNLILNKWEE